MAHEKEDFTYSYDADETYVPYVPLKQRKLQVMQRLHKRAKITPRAERAEDGGEKMPKPPSLLQETLAMREKQQYHAQEKTQAEKDAEEERMILEAHTSRRKLQSHAELAHGVQYTEPLKRSWRPPRFVRDCGECEIEALRRKHHVLTEGNCIPPLISNFRDMKIPPCVLAYLHRENIRSPSPIQMQGLPTVFSGRDMIGIASTGCGKTLTFSLPLILFAAEAERRLPFKHEDGPLGIIICPSRELARQTFDTIRAIAQALAHDGYAEISVLLCIGGISMADQAHTLHKGFHIVVATPGRLQDMLAQRKFGLAACNYLCLDEADRMIDRGFEESIRDIMSYFTQQRQTLLFSATMPRKMLDFAEQSLLQPVVVNVGRAGAASLDVVQEVEYVKNEAKMAYLLESLQKTAPPVIIFSDQKHEVDDIYEYLLLKGVEAVAIHGSKTQDEREYAMQSFKEGNKDVMVASSVASKGLDFHDIQHVINYSMPKEIEDYVHQIGRTGRGGKTGVATTFVNHSAPEQTLLDLKYLLMEAKQRIPAFLSEMQDPRTGMPAGCGYCGGLGHNIKDCPKLEKEQRQAQPGLTRIDHDGY
ncbi:RNA helicase [Malassezia vespertilionis]|uniref:RNA helicase n=1 Tax=Malassezia vespertilionis TaxID=2020962 RepID=A0A2N1JGM9_9BASI|nr:RNA helicase [Malassezia vespertilionis]PKI85689.1 hypothetical protein MVES_000648 [Malassezia vespertilionis]WFD05366.1 RNA helicase [Malassezia vespertilionis]